MQGLGLSIDAALALQILVTSRYGHVIFLRQMFWDKRAFA
jgi:hypothetical protein